jgi:hypothetical protein
MTGYTRSVIRTTLAYVSSLVVIFFSYDPYDPPSTSSTYSMVQIH